MSRETVPFARPPTGYFDVHVLPRVRADLAVREADFARILVELLDADLHLLADFEHFAGMLDAVPTQLADVNEPVDAAQVDERAKILQASHNAFAKLAGRQLGH